MTKKTTTLPQCDCLNYCGDDPWLAQGRAQPCKQKAERDAENVRRGERQAQLAAKLAALRELLGRLDTESTSPWEKQRCGCTRDCESFRLNFISTDGDVEECEVDFIILAREYLTLLIEEQA